LKQTNKNTTRTGKKNYVWICDYCGKEFSTKTQSDKHELSCNENPKNKREIILKLSVPKLKTFFYILLIFFGIYFLSFILVNSYAQSNGLSKKSLINPTKWFGSIPTMTPIPISYPTSLPTATTKPTVKPITKKTTNPTAIINDDPLVNCIYSDKCGGTKQIKTSECNNTVCCGVNDKYYITTKDQCNQDQANSDPDNWPEVITNQGNLVLRCRGNIEAVKRADSVREIAYTAYAQPDLKCITENRDSDQCKQLKTDYDSKYNAFTSTLKTEGCLMKEP